MNTLNQIADTVHALANEKGFYDDKPTEDIFVERACNNMHNEVSELHESWRNNKLRSPCDKAAKMEALGLEPLTCLEEELADIVIRALDNARFLEVDIQKAIETKHSYKASRSHRHGGKRS
ncbi:MAG: hypothetical protein AAFX93_19850 [Verrucomicrobiota bacterium]